MPLPIRYLIQIHLFNIYRNLEWHRTIPTLFLPLCLKHLLESCCFHFAASFQRKVVNSNDFKKSFPPRKLFHISSDFYLPSYWEEALWIIYHHVLLSMQKTSALHCRRELCEVSFLLVKADKNWHYSDQDRTVFVYLEFFYIVSKYFVPGNPNAGLILKLNWSVVFFIAYYFECICVFMCLSNLPNYIFCLVKKYLSIHILIYNL